MNRSTDRALAEFREGLTGDRAFALIQQADGRLLVQLPVGVGKTKWLVSIIIHSLSTGDYDLIVALFPRWDILKEVKEQLPKELAPTILHPRP